MQIDKILHRYLQKLKMARQKQTTNYRPNYKGSCKYVDRTQYK